MYVPRRAFCIFKYIEYILTIMLIILIVHAIYWGHLITNVPKKSKNTGFPVWSWNGISDK